MDELSHQYHQWAGMNQDQAIGNVRTRPRKLQSDVQAAIIFTVPDSLKAIHEATRDVLAWEAIEDDADTRKQRDESQERSLKRHRGRAKSDPKKAIWRACRYISDSMQHAL